MKKIKLVNLLIAAIVIGIAVYNLCIFLLVKEYTEGFWISYAFTMVAFVAQIVLVLFEKWHKKEETFLRMPIMLCSSVYFVIQFLLGVILMIFSVSFEVAVIFNAIVFSAFLITSFVLLVFENNTKVIETRNKAESIFIRELSVRANTLLKRETNGNKKNQLKKLYESILYSDPISSTPEIQKLDQRIAEKFQDLEKNIGKKTTDETRVDIEFIENLLFERNSLCKVSK